MSRNNNDWIPNDLDYYDPNYYSKVMSHNNIWNMDYNLARVFNTPSYCMLLLKDLHGQIESQVLSQSPSIVEDYNPDLMKVEYINEFNIQETVVAVKPKTIETVAINLVIRDILENGRSKFSGEDYELVIKGVAWFLVSHSVVNETSVDLPQELSNEITILNAILIRENRKALFVHLIELCGNRWKAEKSRSFLNEIINQLI